MNKRQVVVLWLLALALGAGAYFSLSSKSKAYDSKTSRSRGQTLVADLPINQVAKIEISGVKENTTLVLKDGKWTVANREGYPAKTVEVNEFLNSLADVKVTQGLDAESSFYPRFGMDPNGKEDKDRGIEVVMSNEAGSQLGSFTFGKNLESKDDGDPMSAMMGGGGSTGRYIRNHADSTGVYATKELFPTLTADPKSWLDQKFVQLEKIKDITVSAPGKPEEVAWKVTRADESAEFTLEGAKEGEALDTTIGGTLKTLFSYARFEDVASADTAAKDGNASDKRTVKVDTVEGFHYTITAMAANAPKAEGKEGAAATPPAADGGTMFVTVDVTADIAAERKKEEKESPEDAKAKDAAFSERKTALEKKLADEKKLAGRVFKINKSTIDPLLKTREDLVKKPDAPGAGAPQAGGLPPGFNPGAMQGLPGGAHGGGATPAPRPRRGPVEAVTPPIAIPPMEERKETPKPEEVKPAEAPKPEEVKPQEARKPEQAKPEEVKPEEAPKQEQPKPEEAPPEQPKEPGQ